MWHPQNKIAVVRRVLHRRAATGPHNHCRQPFLERLILLNCRHNSGTIRPGPDEILPHYIRPPYKSTQTLTLKSTYFISLRWPTLNHIIRIVRHFFAQLAVGSIKLRQQRSNATRLHVMCRDTGTPKLPRQTKEMPIHRAQQ